MEERVEAPTEPVEPPSEPSVGPAPAAPASSAAPALSAPPVASPASVGFGPVSRRFVLVVIAAAIFALVLDLGSSAVGPFVLGLVLAYLLDMPVERMARVGFPRWLSVLIVYAIVLVAIVEFAMLTLRPLADQLASFI